MLMLQKAQRKLSRNLAKCDRGILVQCGTVEELVFGPRHDPEKVHGRKGNRAGPVLATDDREWKRVDREDTDESPGNISDKSAGVQVEDRKHNRSNDTITANIFECQQQAEEWEVVKRAARSACAFRLKLNDKPETAREETPNCKSRRGESQQANIGKPKVSEHKRKCEAVKGGVVVEGSFAKGDWAIRWRE